MKKKLVSVVLAAMMTATLLTGCGGDSSTAATAPTSTAETAPAQDTASEPEAEESTEGETDMVSDETFAALQESYDAMVDAYNAVVDLYNSDEITADADIESLLEEAAGIIEQMGEITQDTITEEDAETLAGAMLDILDGLSALVDGMEEAGDTSADASGDMVSDENFAILQENYQLLTEVYNAVVDAYSSDEVEANAEVEDTLNEAVAILEEMGTIEQETLTAADAEALNEAMQTILDVLTEVAGAIG